MLINLKIIQNAFKKNTETCEMVEQLTTNEAMAQYEGHNFEILNFFLRN